jgi:WD40 repeat protein
MMRRFVLIFFCLLIFIASIAFADDDVYPIAWSPDGMLIVSSDDAGALSVWDANGSLLLDIESPDVTSLAWSPDSRWLASANQNATVSIRDMHRGKLAQTLRPEGDEALRLIWSPGGTRLAAVTEDGTAHIWSAADWTLITTVSDLDARFIRWQGEQLALHTPAALQAVDNLVVVAWNSDESVMAGAQADGKIRLWSTISGERITTLYGYRGMVEQLAYSPTGQQLMSASTDGTISIWDLTTWNEADRVQWPGTPITWSPDGQFLAWVNPDDGVVEVFQAVTEPVKSPCDLCAG